LHHYPGKDTDRLLCLQEAATEYRARLSGIRLENTVIEFVDRLLGRFQRDFKPISDNWAQNNLSNPGYQMTDPIRERYVQLPDETGQDSEYIFEGNTKWNLSILL
jgi:hypothetical protein